MAIKVRIIFAIALTVSLAGALPSGAPASSCVSMVPSHLKTTTSGTPPFKVKLDTTSYKPGSTITGSIYTPTNVTFRGFLIQARPALNQTLTPIGTFINPVNLTHTVCGQGSEQGLTHSNNTDKLEVVFTWKAPDQYAGDIVFRVTIVECYNAYNISRYWLNILSDNVFDCSLHANDSDCADISTEVPVTQPTATSPSPTPTTPQGPAGTIIRDEQCGITKGCFSDCDDDSCTYQVTWQASEDKTTVEFDLKVKMDSTQDVYIAAGISPDGRMAGTDVIACLSQNDGLKMESSLNVGYTNKVFKNSTLGLSLPSGDVVDGVVHCNVKRQTSMPNSELMNLTSQHYLLVTSGPVVSGLITKHTTIPYKTKDPVDFLATGIATADTSVSILIKVHASMMILAWVFFSSIGIVAARHCKAVLANELYMGVKAWFLVHRPAMILATLCLIAGFVAIFVEVKRFSSYPAGPDYVDAHPFLGTVVGAFTLLNPIMAMFRPSADSKNRYIFNWAHFAVGTSAHISAIVTIFFGLKLDKARANVGAFYVMVAYAIFFMFVQTVLEIYNCSRKQTEQVNKYVRYGTDHEAGEKGHTTTTFEGQNYGATRSGPLSATDGSLSTSVKKRTVEVKQKPASFAGYMLLLHGLVMMGMAGLLIAITCVPIHLV